MKKIVAKSFTTLYDEVEDRIRLIVNYQDFNNRVDFMITRKFTIELLPTLEEFYHSHYGEITIEYNINKKKTFDKKLLEKTQVEDIKLYQKNSILLKEVKLYFKQPLTVIEFKSMSVTVVATFNINTLKIFILNFRNAIPIVGWGIGF